MANIQHSALTTSNLHNPKGMSIDSTDTLVYVSGTNVGINEGSPAYKLHINGTSRVSSLNINDAIDLPTADGNADEAIVTDGAGTVSFKKRVQSIGISGSTGLQDDVILVSGTNVTLAQSNNTITIASAAGDGEGDIKADGTIPMTANWDIGNFDLTMKSLTCDGTITDGAASLSGGSLSGVTLVTPNIGTPGAGTLTSCTGLPAAAVVAGTLGTGNYVVDGDLEINQHATFDAEVANVVTASGCALDWGTGNKQRLTMDDDCAVTFTAPDGVGNFLLHAIQDGSGGHALTFVTSVKWPDGTEPTYTTGADAEDILTFYYDGTSYFGVGSLDFTV